MVLRRFFNRKRIIMTAVFGLTVFLISLLSAFIVSPSEQLQDLMNLKYTYSPRRSVYPSASGNMTEIEKVEDAMRDSGGQYLIIEAVLPDLSEGQLYMNSFNAAARISVDGEVIFDGLEAKGLSAYSHVKIPLPDDFAGKTVEVILYSPFSSELSIGVIPADCTLHTLTKMPYASVLISAAVSAALIVSLFCILPGRNKRRLDLYIYTAAAVVCLFVTLLEYGGLFAFPFSLKMCLFLLVPALYLFGAAVRYKPRGSYAYAETVLSLNVLYITCVAFFGGSALFVPLIKAGLILQIAGFIFVLQTFARQDKGESDVYAAAAVIFWISDIVFWYMLVLGGQRLRISLPALIFSGTLYCLAASAESLKDRNREVFPEETREKIPEIRMNKSVNKFGRKAADEFTGKSVRNFAEESECRTDEKFVRSSSGETEKTEKTGETGYLTAEKPTQSFAEKFSRKHAEAYAEETGEKFYRGFYSVSRDALFSMICELADKRLYGRDFHSLNVAEYTYLLCITEGIRAENAEKISRAAALHDIGKICIPDQILFKSGKLSKNEFAEIRKHNVYGYHMLNIDGDPFFNMAALVARDHHEHIDGSGYLGLKGEEISVPARIVAVADVFDALVSPRSFKNSWSFEEACIYIAEHRGDYFDGDAVEAFVKAKADIYDIYRYHLERLNSSAFNENN